MGSLSRRITVSLSYVVWTCKKPKTMWQYFKIFFLSLSWSETIQRTKDALSSMRSTRRAKERRTLGKVTAAVTPGQTGKWLLPLQTLWAALIWVLAEDWVLINPNWHQVLAFNKWAIPSPTHLSPWACNTVHVFSLLNVQFFTYKIPKAGNLLRSTVIQLFDCCWIVCWKEISRPVLLKLTYPRTPRQA